MEHYQTSDEMVRHVQACVETGNRVGALSAIQQLAAMDTPEATQALVELALE